MTHSIYKTITAIAVSFLAACGAQAYEVPLTYFGTNLPPLDFHGFASQGFLQSDQYNYLGDSTAGSFLFSEAGINASINPFPKTRITAQGFMYDVGEHVGNYDVVLDYASIEYTLNDYIGVRAGRIIRPQGIYNAIQSVDVARTFVLLPQGMYDARWRDFYCDLDGGEFFGDLPLGKAGDLSYEAYGGVGEPAMNGGFANDIRYYLPSYAQLDNIQTFVSGGCQLWYNTPINGLRAGFAFDTAPDVEDSATFFLPPIYGGPQAALFKLNYLGYQASLEYLWKGWTFQAEYLLKNTEETEDFPAALGGPNTFLLQQDSWYAAASYQINKYFQAGAYYTEYYGDTSQRGNSLDYQKDAALALRFDPTSWWTIKVEGHCIRGTGLLEDNATNPLPKQQANRIWFMLALKTTLSF